MRTTVMPTLLDVSMTCSVTVLGLCIQWQRAKTHGALRHRRSDMRYSIACLRCAGMALEYRRDVKKIGVVIVWLGGWSDVCIQFIACELVGVIVDERFETLTCGELERSVDLRQVSCNIKFSSRDEWPQA